MRTRALRSTRRILSELFGSTIGAGRVKLITHLRRFKKTKAMSALLEERIKRRKSAVGDGEDARKSSHKRAASPSADDGARSLQNLVESVKRKSASSGSGEPRPQKRKKAA